MKPETDAWRKSSDDDIALATMAFAEGIYQPAVFHCQQPVENLLKALWTERTAAGSPPRTHDLIRLAGELSLTLSIEHEELLEDLTTEYGPSHYPDVGTAYTEAEAGAYLSATRDVVSWLRRHLS